MKGIRNFLLTSGIFALYQSVILFVFVFSIIRSYPFIYGPIPQTGQNYLEAYDHWNSSYQTLFTLLMVFEFITGAISLIIVAQSPCEFPDISSTHVNIGGTRYEVAKQGDYYSITKGTDNSELSNLIVRTLVGIIFVPINIAGAIIKLFILLFNKKYNFAYENVNIIDYWLEMLHTDVNEKWRVLYSQSFIWAEIIIGTVVISLSFVYSPYI